MALPTIDFAGPVIRAAIASLQAGMPGQVAAFNAEPANLAALEAPTVYHFGGQDVLDAFPFPQVEVFTPSGRTGNWAVQRVEVDHDLRLNVVVWTEGDTGEIPDLAEKALGYARCVIECLAPPDACGPRVELAQENAVVWQIDVIPGDPTADGREFRRWRAPAFIQLGLETVERFA
jgi:hypothetical protein